MIFMKRVILITALFLFSASTLVSCRTETEKETIIREVEVKEPIEEKKGILERTGERIDKKVNEEIEEEIDNIGNK